MLFSNDPKRDLRRTFRRPPVGRVRKGSLLVVLRGDLQLLYGPEESARGRVATPLLAALGTLAGLELLAKYWSGTADTTQRTVREFLTLVAGMSREEAEGLMQFRNSLAHGYGLTTRRRVDQKPFAFSLDTVARPGAPVIVAHSAESYVVNLWSLKLFFLTAIKQCRKALVSDVMRLGRFRACIRNLREIRISA